MLQLLWLAGARREWWCCCGGVRSHLLHCADSQRPCGCVGFTTRPATANRRSQVPVVAQAARGLQVVHAGNLSAICDVPAAKSQALASSVHRTCDLIGQCSLCRSGGVVAVEVMGLPPMTSIAAGHSHCLMTDGQRVWAMGSWLLSSGKKVQYQRSCLNLLQCSKWCRRVSSGAHQTLLRCCAAARIACALPAY